MKGTVRKIEIVAANEGLRLLPIVQQGQHARRVPPGIRIRYGSDKTITQLDPANNKHDEEVVSIETHGIVGLFTVAGQSYLIAIASRKQVAQISGRHIHLVTGIVLLPLSSQADAVKAIKQAKAKLQKQAAQDNEDTESEISGDEEATQIAPSPTEADAASDRGDAASTVKKDEAAPQASVAEDVIKKKGNFGRFIPGWLSKKGWKAERAADQGMSSKGAREDGSASGSSPGPAPTAKEPSKSLSLLPKLLRTTETLFCSQNMFFSYDWDLTRRIGTQVKGSDLPLHKACDDLYFWNRHLASPFINARQHHYVLPIVQGFVGQRAFTVNTTSDDPGKMVAAVAEDPSDVIELQDNAASVSQDFKSSEQTRDYLVTLISRRSTKRAGLRYLRRGIDDQGNPANSVETEQILSRPSWDPSQNVYSFNQYRGSIPLYFSQQPYSFKPVPTLQHSYNVNHLALKHHFVDLESRYGDIQTAALVDKHGVEAKIGEAYEEHVRRLNEERPDKQIDFEWFDFHKVCRGMRFDKVSLLVDTLAPQLDRFGYTTECNGKTTHQQSGIVRTNCMDCLDRTNVVQSALAARMLERQLRSEGIALDLQTDTTSQWFNTLFADNGDALSAQYTGTNALKGDYTRTRQRNYRGALNDLGLTLNRYYNNMVTDYFHQAAIDFLLGTVTEGVFDEYEANLSSDVPAMSIETIRQTAIETSEKIVVADAREELVGAWTLLAPRQFNTVRTYPFEESVLLLTDRALYAVRFDWDTEKVAAFERVELRRVVGILLGVYVTSTLTAGQMDERRNVGFVVKYRPCEEGGSGVRVNTRSMSTSVKDMPMREEDPAEESEAVPIPLEGGDAVVEEPRSISEAHHSPSATQQSQAHANNQEPSVPPSLNNDDVNPNPTHPASNLLSSSSSSSPKPPPPASSPKPPKPSDLHILAFKALPPRSTTLSSSPSPLASMSPPPTTLPPQPEREQMRVICEEIKRAVGERVRGTKRRGGGGDGKDAREGGGEGEGREGKGEGGGHGEDYGEEEGEAFIEESDIIGLEQARRSTGLIEQWGFALKRFVWA